MKRKVLEELGLEKEVIDKIMTENGNDVNIAKADYEILKQQFDETSKQLQERNAKLIELEKKSEDYNLLEKKFSELQMEHQTEKEGYETQINEVKMSAAIKLAIGNSAQDALLVNSLIDRSKLAFEENGNVSGLDEQLRTLKKEKAFLFKEETPTTVLKGGKPVEGNGRPSMKKVSEMTYSELCSYMDKNEGVTID